MKKQRSVSLRFSLGTAITGMVVATTILLGTVTYFTARNRMRSDLESKLGVLVTAIAVGIAAEDHAQLIDPAQMDEPLYLGFRARFREIIAQEPRIGYIYSFRRLPDGSLMFVLDSGEDPEDLSPIGMAYDESFPLLLSAFDPPYHTIVDSEFAEDEYGTWLSAYAPILWPDGRLEGVLGVDITASDVISEELRLLLIMGSITLVVSLLGILGGTLLSRKIVEPLTLLAQDMGQIRNLQLNDTSLGTSDILEVQTMETALSNMKRGSVPSRDMCHLTLWHSSSTGTRKRDWVPMCIPSPASSRIWRTSPMCRNSWAPIW